MRLIRGITPAVTHSSFTHQEALDLGLVALGEVDSIYKEYKAVMVEIGISISNSLSAIKRHI